MTVYTVFRLDDHRGMISLPVELFRQLQRLPRAELDTVTTSFTSVFQDVNDALSDVYGIRVKRKSPEFHCPFPLLREKIFYFNEEKNKYYNY
jgi:hypothetical protein